MPFPLMYFTYTIQRVAQIVCPAKVFSPKTAHFLNSSIEHGSHLEWCRYIMNLYCLGHTIIICRVSFYRSLFGRFFIQGQSHGTFYGRVYYKRNLNAFCE